MAMTRMLSMGCAAAALLGAGQAMAQTSAVAPIPGIGTNQGQGPGGDPLKARMEGMRAAMMKRVADAKAKPTPRLADGKPDLNGLWGGGGGPAFEGKKEDGNVALIFPDYGAGGKRAVPDGPKYKAELTKKVEYNDVHSSFVDKMFQCGMPGVPRLGPPQQIMQNGKEVVLLYVDLAGEVFRHVPTDGRTFRDEIDASYNGDSVGHWEGDTLVVDTKNFSDETWFGGRGYFHSDKMTVRETFTREGENVAYVMTVTDPEVLLEPWTQKRDLLSSQTRLEEPPPCMDIVKDHLVNTDNHS